MPDSACLLVSASNLGMSTIRNVRFTVSGEGFTPTEPEYFAGTIEPGQQVSYEFELIPYQGGFMTGTVTYTYGGARRGEVYTETQEFIFDVIDTSSVMNPEAGRRRFLPGGPRHVRPSGMEEEQGFCKIQVGCNRWRSRGCSGGGCYSSDCGSPAPAKRWMRMKITLISATVVKHKEDYRPFCTCQPQPDAAQTAHLLTVVGVMVMWTALVMMI